MYIGYKALKCTKMRLVSDVSRMDIKIRNCLEVIIRIRIKMKYQRLIKNALKHISTLNGLMYHYCVQSHT